MPGTFDTFLTATESFDTIASASGSTGNFDTFLTATESLETLAATEDEGPPVGGATKHFMHYARLRQ